MVVVLLVLCICMYVFCVHPDLQATFILSYIWDKLCVVHYCWDIVLIKDHYSCGLYMT